MFLEALHQVIHKRNCISNLDKMFIHQNTDKLISINISPVRTKV